MSEKACGKANLEKILEYNSGMKTTAKEKETMKNNITAQVAWVLYAVALFVVPAVVGGVVAKTWVLPAVVVAVDAVVSAIIVRAYLKTRDVYVRKGLW